MILDEIRAIVRTYADVGDDDPLDLESLAMVQLVEQVEARFDLVLSARDMTPDNFGTVRALAALVERLA